MNFPLPSRDPSVAVEGIPRQRFSTQTADISDQLNRLHTVLNDIDDFARDLGSSQSKFTVTWMSFGLCMFFSTQFVAISWSANLDGTFNFYTSNLWLSVALLGFIFSFTFIKFDFYSSKRFKNHFRKNLLQILFVQCLFSFTSILGLVAPTQVPAQVCAALWFSRICFTEFFSSLFSFKIPTLIQISLLVSVLLLVFLYTILAMKSSTQTSLLGISFFMFYIFCQGLLDVTQTRLLSETLGDLKDKEKMAFSFATQIPVWIPFIILEGYFLKKSFSPLNLIPFYGFGFRGFCLCLFELYGLFLCWKIQAQSITLFILVAYTGTIFGVGLSYLYKGLSTFYLPTFILSLVIFLITLTYAYMVSMHERMASIENCVNMITEARLPEYSIFRKFSSNGLGLLKTRLSQEEKSLVMFETRSHYGGHYGSMDWSVSFTPQKRLEEAAHHRQLSNASSNYARHPSELVWPSFP